MLEVCDFVTSLGSVLGENKSYVVSDLLIDETFD